MFKHSRLCSRHGISGAFTMVELLVVIGIVSALIAILMPALNKARQAGNAIACASNVRQIGLAMIMYANENKGNLPGAVWLNTASAKSPAAYTTQLCAAGYLNWGPSGTIPGYDTFNPQRHGGPVGAGMLVYYGYIRNLQVLYCPARNPASQFSAQKNLDPSQRNVTAKDYRWNPGWNGGTDNWGFWVQGGYLVATSDTNDTPSAGYMNCAKLHKVGFASSDLPMVMDVCTWGGAAWGMEGWRNMNQGKGYNVCGFDGSVTFYRDEADILERHFCLPGAANGSAPIFPGEAAVNFGGNGPYMLNTTKPNWPYCNPAAYLNNYGNLGADPWSNPNANGISWILHNWMKWGDAKIQRAVLN